MTTGVLDPRTDMLVDMAQPVNRQHLLNRDLLAWWLALPGTVGGAQYMDIQSPGPNGNHGILSLHDNAKDWRASDRPGGWWALNSDGVNDFVTFGDIRGSDAGDQLTVIYNIRPRTLSDGDGHVNKWDDGAGGAGNTFGVRANSVAPFDEILVFIAAAADGGDNFFTTTDTILVVGVWIQICFVYNGALPAADRLKVYKDGKQASGAITGVIPTSLNAGTHPVRISRLIDINLSSDGLWDDFRIHNRAYTDDEVNWYFQLSQQSYPGLLNRIPAFGKFIEEPVPPPPPLDPWPEYGQGRAAIGDPSVYGATIVRR